MVKATADKVAADMSPPNYRGAYKVLGTIDPKKAKIASLNGEIGGIFDRVEGFKVNKKAAKIFMALDKLEAVERNDIMKSLEGLIGVAEWDRSDLLTLPNGGDDNPGGGDEDEDDEVAEIADEITGEKPNTDEIDEVTEVVGEKPDEADPPAVNAFLERSKRHLKAVPTAGKKPDPEPYTGDNSDLNPPDAAAR
jgi:hypothetical protein